MRRAVGALLVLVLVLTGCGDSSGSTAEPAVARAAIEGDGRMLVPVGDLPAGMHLWLVDRDVDTHLQSWLALYGDPDAEDPLAEDVVHVIYSTGEETRSHFRPGRAGETTWVSAFADDDDQEVDEVVIGGSGVGEDTLRGFLDRIRVGDPVQPDAELRPAHLADEDLDDHRQLLAEGPIDLAELWYVSGGAFSAGSVLGWRSADGPHLLFSTVRADPAAALLVRSAIDDPDGTTIRGTGGALGPPRTVRTGDRAVLLASWVEDGLLVLVESTGIEREALQDVLAGLRMTTDDDWPALVEEAEQAPPIYGNEFAWGGEAGQRWSARLRPEELPPIEVDLESVDRGSFSNGTAGGCPQSEVGYLSIPAGSLITGISPAGTARVAVEQSPDRVTEATVHPLPDGRAFWAAWIAGHGIAEVTAYDTAGTIVQEADPDLDQLPQMGGSGGRCL